MPPRRAPPARSAPPARQPDWRAAGPVGPGRRGGAGTPLDAAVVARSWPPGRGRPLLRSEAARAVRSRRLSRPPGLVARSRPSVIVVARSSRPPRAFRTLGLAPTYPYQRVAQASVASPACQSAIADGLVGQKRRTARGKGGFRRPVNSMGRAPRLWAPQRRPASATSMSQPTSTASAVSRSPGNPTRRCAGGAGARSPFTDRGNQHRQQACDCSPQPVRSLIVETGPADAPGRRARQTRQAQRRSVRQSPRPVAQRSSDPAPTALSTDRRTWPGALLPGGLLPAPDRRAGEGHLTIERLFCTVRGRRRRR